MNTDGNVHHYVPIFSSIVESSLWDEPDCVCKVFLTILALKEKDHVVRKHLSWIAKCARKTEAETADAIKVLESPDPRRSGQAYQGRRLQRQDGGWLILNGSYYQQQMQITNRRARQAKWARDKRLTQRPLKGEAEYCKKVKAGASDEELNAHVAVNLPV